jgi:hypothetical protein
MPHLARVSRFFVGRIELRPRDTRHSGTQGREKQAAASQTLMRRFFGSSEWLEYKLRFLFGAANYPLSLSITSNRSLGIFAGFWRIRKSVEESLAIFLAQTK